MENFVVAMIAAPGCRLAMHARCAAIASPSPANSLHSEYSQWRVVAPSAFSGAVSSVA